MTTCSEPAFPGPEELKTSCMREDRQLPSSEQHDQASRPNPLPPQGFAPSAWKALTHVLHGSLSVQPGFTLMSSFGREGSPHGKGHSPLLTFISSLCFIFPLLVPSHYLQLFVVRPPDWEL